MANLVWKLPSILGFKHAKMGTLDFFPTEPEVSRFYSLCHESHSFNTFGVLFCWSVAILWACLKEAPPPPLHMQTYTPPLLWMRQRRARFAQG